jgi:hypothetical protein
MTTNVADPAAISRALLFATGASFVVACLLAFLGVLLVRKIVAKPRLRVVGASAILISLLAILWIGTAVFLAAADAQLHFGEGEPSAATVFVHPGPIHQFTPITGAAITWVIASLILRRRDSRVGKAA